MSHVITNENKPQHIRKRREALGFSQKFVASLVGVSQTHLCNIEGGARPVSKSLAPKLAEALNMPVSELPVSGPSDETKRLRLAGIEKTIADKVLLRGSLDNQLKRLRKTQRELAAELSTEGETV